MIDLLVEYRHWLAGTVHGRLASSACSSGRRWPASAAFARMARECRHESGQEG